MSGFHSGEMTKEILVEACKKNGGYSQPRLNDQLYLQYKGFTKIQNLEPYVDLKVLWLEQNGIDTIEGLSGQSKLVSLFLQNNIIRKVGNGLESLGNLRILNLSYNILTRLDGLRCCPLLETLTICHCKLESLSAMDEVMHLKELSTLDVSFNQIVSVEEREYGSTDSEADRLTLPQGVDSPMIKFFQQMPALSVLYLHGNELIRSLKDYRRNMVAHLSELAYLDERPVFPEERRTTMAWLKGGVNAEGSERDLIRQEKREAMSGCVNDMVQLRERTKDQRERKEKERREWDAAKENWEADQRLAEVKWATEQDHEEYEGRGLLEQEEEQAWTPLAEELSLEYPKLARLVQQQQEEALAKLEAQKELAEEEAALERDAKLVRLDKEAERALWLKRLVEEEDLYMDGMQEELDGFLDQLTPGNPNTATTTTTSATTDQKNAVRKNSSSAATPQQMLTMPTPTSTSNSHADQHRKQREGKRTTTGASTPPQQPTAAAARTQVVSKTATVKSSGGKKNAVWEQYYAFEQAAARRYNQQTQN